MDAILQGLPRVICYLNDLLIAETTSEEHLMNLAEVLDRLSKHEMRLKQEKSKFLLDSVEYLRHGIDTDGVRTSPSKMEAISKAPAPKNVTELHSFL